MYLPTDYCPHCCVVHVTCECPREDETEKQYWLRMEKYSEIERARKTAMSLKRLREFKIL